MAVSVDAKIALEVNILYLEVNEGIACVIKEAWVVERLPFVENCQTLPRETGFSFLASKPFKSRK